MKLFGTNGVRGIVNESMTPEIAMKLAQSLATYMNGEGTVVVGNDTRISGRMLKSAVISGLLSSGMKVTDLGCVPTPALQNYVKKSKEASAGIIVTASHNPREYNGIKLISEDGTEFSRENESAVEDIYFKGEFLKASWENTGNYKKELNANEMYVNDIVSLVDSELIKSCNFKVAIDTGCGAGSLTLPLLLKKLGCKTISINAQPDGTFPWRNPEPVESSLTELSKIVSTSQCDLGIAHDGDADRTVFLDENGKFLDEDLMLAAVGKFILKETKGPIVTPVSSSSMMGDIAKEAGVDIYWTRVGSIDVAYKMKEVDAVYGGEGNGGLIFPKHQFCRDGGMTAAVVLDIIAKNKMKVSKFRDAVSSYVNIKIKENIVDPKKVVEKIQKEISLSDGMLDINKTDGVKITCEKGWILIRPSGTEEIVRITAEAKNKTDAEKLIEIGKNILRKAVTD
ncbi:MAG: phosphoglucosamine mutase [Methanosarcinaceae archaeon]|nr:phosphoglucosamine mutase [Methanosarcinaceae archaeon]